MPFPSVSRSITWASVFTLTYFCVGCSSTASPTTVPARGQVLIGGKSVEGLSVTLVPADSRGEKLVSSARVNADGSFILTSYDPSTRKSYEGAPPGQYVVLLTLTATAKAKTEDGRDRGRWLDPRYKDPQKSPLRAEVRDGTLELPTIQLPESALTTSSKNPSKIYSVKSEVSVSCRALPGRGVTMTTELVVHECGCAACQAGDHPQREDHKQLNLLLSRLDEQQRRWVAAREAKRLGHGGFERVAKITGLHPETIRRGRDELEGELHDRPTDRIRLPGGGRPRVEKKIQL